MYMISLIDRVILLAMGYLIIGSGGIKEQQVVYMLLGGILMCITYITHDLRQSRLESFLYYLMMVITFFVTGFTPFIPMVLYAFIYKYYDNKRDIRYFMAFTVAIMLCDFYDIYHHQKLYGILKISVVNFQAIDYILFLLFLVLSVDMAFKSKSNKILSKSMKRFRDDSWEMTYLLEEKNKSLRNHQDKEVRIAVLSERNRIAREIHDNVGHLLSRSILQVGAIMAVSKDNQVKKLLTPVRDTLDEAMNSVRESVHDLHKESFDIDKAARAILGDLGNFRVEFACDISMDADKDIKYAFLTILKEAVNNIVKYCDGDEVHVYMRELEEYYQMVIEDNGMEIRKKQYHADAQREYGTGIGLINMQDRVKLMNGLIHFSYENGFRIFISVPKILYHHPN